MNQLKKILSMNVTKPGQFQGPAVCICEVHDPKHYHNIGSMIGTSLADLFMAIALTISVIYGYFLSGSLFLLYFLAEAYMAKKDYLKYRGLHHSERCSLRRGLLNTLHRAYTSVP